MSQKGGREGEEVEEEREEGEEEEEGELAFLQRSIRIRKINWGTHL